MIRSDVFSRGIPWMRLLFRDNLVSREIGDLNLKMSGILSVIMAWAGMLLLFMSAYRLGFIYGTLFSWMVMVLANLRTYWFFWRIRGPQFAVMIIPLNFVFHLCNGVSVVGALVYHLFIDNPIMGFKARGKGRPQRYRTHPDNQKNRRL